jgi:hypothetical protein
METDSSPTRRLGRKPLSPKGAMNVAERQQRWREKTMHAVMNGTPSEMTTRGLIFVLPHLINAGMATLCEDVCVEIIKRAKTNKELKSRKGAES